MDLDSQRRSARTRRLAPAALLLLAGTWGAGAARADIYVHVVNCTGGSMKAQAFDAKDSVKAVGASEKSFSYGNPGESQQLHCAGEGKGYCQMEILVESPPDEGSGCGTTYTGGSASFNLDSDKYALVTGYKLVDTGGNGSNAKCAPVVSNDQDSATCP